MNISCSGGLSRNIRKASVSVYVKPTNTIRSMLVAPKDKPKKCDQSCVVYGIKCNDCSSNYVCETERQLRKCLQEHKKASSPVGAHMNKEGHSFTEENVNFWMWTQNGYSAESRRLITGTPPPAHRL